MVKLSLSLFTSNLLAVPYVTQDINFKASLFCLNSLDSKTIFELGCYQSCQKSEDLELDLTQDSLQCYLAI